MSVRADAPHDLLFGLLALQTGLINQSALVAGFHEWTQAKDRPMADVLVEQGGLDASHRALLEGLVAAHLRLQGGDVAKSLAALKVGLSTRESLRAGAGDNPQVEATLAHLGSGSTDATDTDRTATYSVGAATSDGQRFRVLRPHAQGGLGAVFIALDGELHREVALKQILDHHADDPTSRSRFLLEAEITGGLEHPGIVPVYGLGSYADGRPYYAMRFIRGDSLKEAIAAFHADSTLKADSGARSLALRKLLRRFTDVCNAIDYAHGRGVVHRDIKPGNVIVGRHGETLVVDWGLAKTVTKMDLDTSVGERRLNPSSSSASAETLAGSALGTPGYMSPEQAAGDIDRLGTRSDVYSLGATLYCLLTGRAPFEGDDVGAVLRRVQDGSFSPPRAVDPTIDRALEAVCLKAMATKPDARFASCRALADDIERWAADEPVSAWPEPFSTRARRWMRRNRPAVSATAAAVLVALAGTAAVLAVQTRANHALKSTNKNLDVAQKATAAERDAKEQQRAAKEAEAAKAVAINRFLIDKVLVQADPKNNRVDDKITVLQAFDSAAKGVAGSFADQPEVEAEVRMAIGATYRGLGAFEKARDQHQAAYELLRREKTDLDPGALNARSELALDLERLGRSAESRGILETVLRAQRRVLPADHSDTLTTFDRLATAIASLGKYAEAEAIQRELLAARRRVLGPDDPLTLGAYNNLALTLWSQTKFAEAEAMQREVVAARGRVFGPEHPDTLTTKNNLGLTLWSAGKYREAELIHRELLAVRRRVLGLDHPSTLTTINNLALTLGSLGRLQDAEDMERELLAARRRIQGDEHPATIFALNNLAFTLNARRKHDEAVTLQREVVAARGRVLGSVHPDTLMAVNNLAVYLDKGNRSAEAERLVKQALDLVQDGKTPRPAEVRVLTLVRGRLLTRMGRAQEAEPLLRETLANYRKALPQADWRVGFAESLTGECLLAQGLHAEAEPLLLSGATVIAHDRAAGVERQREALDRVVALYAAWGKPADAALWRIKRRDADFPMDAFVQP